MHHQTEKQGIVHRMHPTRLPAEFESIDYCVNGTKKSTQYDRRVLISPSFLRSSVGTVPRRSCVKTSIHHKMSTEINPSNPPLIFHSTRIPPMRRQIHITSLHRVAMNVTQLQFHHFITLDLLRNW